MTEEKTQRKEVWAAGDRYEPYVGRWSRLVAGEFIDWLAVPAGKDWLDVGAIRLIARAWAVRGRK